MIVNYFLTRSPRIHPGGHKFNIMTRKAGFGALLALGAAAFGAYKYSKMSDQQKKDLLSKGKKLVNENLGGVLGRKNASSMNNATA